MAEPTISLTAAKASTEALRALNFLNFDGSNASVAQVDVWLVRQLKAQVLKSELYPLNAADEATKRAELRAVGW
jgi:hypothetical protein